MYSSIEEVIVDIKTRKKPFVLVDSEDRENEGDLVIPAELADRNIINFMITHCKGIVCTCITESLAKKLELGLMKRSEIKANNAYFTVSIEAKDGVTTGISATDRAHTINLLTKDDVKKEYFITPGHIFPLIVNKKGLGGRSGHTEGGATITKLAGFKPIAVICEILDENGDSASKEYLSKFIMRYDLKLTSIKILQDYLSQNKLEISFD